MTIPAPSSTEHGVMSPVGAAGCLSVPPVCGESLPLDGARTLPEAFARSVERFADRVALRSVGSDRVYTWREYGELVAAYAGGLAGLGVRRGEVVGLMLANRPEFFLVDTAAQHLGATTCSVYNTSSPNQLAYILEDSANRVMVTERQFLPAVRAAMRVGGRVEHLVVVDGPEQGAIGLDELAQRAPAGFDLATAASAVEPEDVATVIYTSGTTGPPKGVELTHANLIAQWNMLVRVWPIRPGGRLVSYLPSAHIADRVGGLYLTNNLGYTATCCPDPTQLGAALAECRPTLFVGVPRVWEKLKAGIEARLAAAPDEARAAFAAAFAAGLDRVRAEQAGSAPDPLVAARAASEDERVFASIRAKLGLDQAEVLMVGAAPTPRQVHEFFAAIGLMLAEVWGMSELSCAATWNPPGRIKLGTCGPALPGVDVRLGEDGEVLVAGPIVMRGYRNQPGKTAEAIDQQGYLHSGDIGRLDQDGYLTIVDRKKEVIINSAGKNMSPANIEAVLKTSSPLIGQAACIGDARPYNVALLVLDPDAVPAFATAHALDGSDLAAFAREPQVLAEVQAAVARANATLSRVEQIKRWTLLPTEWPPAGDELTPTMKLRRKSISAKYADDIEALYTG